MHVQNMYNGLENQVLTVQHVQKTVQKQELIRMSQKQRTLEEIIPKRLTLVERRWTNKDGSESVSYRIRVYSSELKKYNFISLESTSVSSAKLEGIKLYGTLVSDIETGKAIGNDKRKLTFYIDMFLDHMEVRRKNGHITHHRVVVVRQLLRSLEKFADEHKNPNITSLIDLYEEKYEEWRDRSLTRLTAKALTANTRNNEIQVHRQFFNHLKNKDIIRRSPVTSKFKRQSTNKPFPQKNYSKLMSVMRKEIEQQKHPKIKWNWQCMRTVILLMSGTGCRVTEVKNLRWSHITLDKNKLPRIHFEGKGKERDITVSKRVYGYLMDLKEFKKVWGRDWEWNEKEYEMVFSSWRMKKMLNQFDSWGRRNWYEQSGVDPKEYPLVCFRHKFISDALRNGSHALQIANYTGTSVKMIQMTYGSITAPELYDQVFLNSSTESQDGKERTKWFEKILSQGRERDLT